MSERGVLQLPTAATLRYLASGSETGQVMRILDMAHDGHASPELLAGLDALGLRIGLQHVFEQAGHGLRDLDDRRPAAIRASGGVSKELIGSLPAQADEFHDSVGAYVRQIETDIATPDGVGQLKQALASEAAWPGLMRRIAVLQDCDAEWLRTQAGQSVAAIKENLLEAVVAGYDTAAFAGERGIPFVTAVSYVAGWRETADTQIALQPVNFAGLPRG